MSENSLRRSILDLITESVDEERWNAEVTCTGNLWGRINKYPSGDPMIVREVDEFMVDFCDYGNSCQCSIYNKLEELMNEKKSVSVDREYDLVPYGYYMSTMLSGAKDSITDDRNRNHVLFKFLHRVNQEYNPSNGTIWSDQHIERMLMFVENPNLSTATAIGTMLSYWSDAHEAYHELLYPEFPNVKDESVEDVVFYLIESELALERLRRVAKQLEIDVDDVLDTSGLLGGADEYVQEHTIKLQEKERIMLSDFLVTQIEIHEDQSDMADKVWSDQMIGILRNLEHVVGTEK